MPSEENASDLPRQPCPAGGKDGGPRVVASGACFEARLSRRAPRHGVCEFFAYRGGNSFPKPNGNSPRPTSRSRPTAPLPAMPASSARPTLAATWCCPAPCRFAEPARGGGVKMLYQHDPDTPIGVWQEIREDGRGLWFGGG